MASCHYRRGRDGATARRSRAGLTRRLRPRTTHRLRPCTTTGAGAPWSCSPLPGLRRRADRALVLLRAPPNPTAAKPGDGRVQSSPSLHVHQPVTFTEAVGVRAQTGLTGAGSHVTSYGGFGGGHQISSRITVVGLEGSGTQCARRTLRFSSVKIQLHDAAAETLESLTYVSQISPRLLYVPIVSTSNDIANSIEQRPNPAK